MRRALLPWLMTAPSLAIFGGLFVAPLLYFLAISFWTVKFYRLLPGFTLANYGQALGGYVGIGLFTLEVALLTAALTTALGFLYAYIIRFKAGPLAMPLLFAAMLTLFGGYLMKIYAWKTILGNEGLLNSALIGLGIVREPVAALLYSPTAVVVTLLYFLLPFAILPIYGAMRSIDEIELEAARDLGAGRWQAVRDVVLPRCRQGLVAAFTLAFLVASGDYITPILVGGKMTLVGNLIAPQFGQYFNWPLGAAMSFVVLLLAVAVFALSSLAARRALR